MGDFRHKKRLKDIVWAFDLLGVIRPTSHLLLLGTGARVSDLQAFIRPALFADRIHLLGFRSDVHRLLSQCSCLWQASEDEGCPNTLLEAMAVGLPVVASDIAGHREVLQGDKLGATMALGDCAEMARRTNLLLDRPQQAEAQARKAQESVLEKYEDTRMVQGYCEFYSSLLHRRTARAG